MDLERAMAESEVSSLRADRASPVETLLFVAALALLFLAACYVLLLFWPSQGSSGTVWGIRLGELDEGARLFVLVMAAGALGSLIHVATSAGDYIGNQRLGRSWIYWYLLRIPVGSSLALLVYFLLRGGVLTGAQLQAEGLGLPYGIIGLSALAGMFSKKASNKLADVFDALFKSDRDQDLADKIDGKRPVIERIVPDPLREVGRQKATVTLLGERFRQGARVRFGGVELSPLFESARKLRLDLEAEHLAKAGIVKVRVVQGDEPGESSEPYPLELRLPPERESTPDPHPPVSTSDSASA